MYEQSHRDYLRSGYLHHRLAVALLIITVIIITYKAQRDKNARELKLANAAITDMQRRSAQMLRSMQNTQQLLMLKLKMMLCVMMLPLVVVGCTSKQSVSQCEATTASGVDNAASPRLADTAERDYFTLREADHYAKQLEVSRSILMSSDRASIDGQPMHYCEQ